MASWRYATEKENELFQELPTPEPVEDTGIYKVLYGKVVCREGHELLIPDGKVVKLLQADRGEPWCYQTKKMTVLVLEKEVSLRPGTWVAIFSPV